MVDVKIENVILSAQVEEHLNLPSLSKAMPKAEYNPEQFPAVVRRVGVEGAALIFASGKIVCTGIEKLEEGKEAIVEVTQGIRRAGVKTPKKPTIQVENVIATSNLGKRLSLNAVATCLGLEKVEYDPERFPGLVYHLDELNATLLLFDAGKVACTAKSLEDAEIAIGKLAEHLSKADFL